MRKSYIWATAITVSLGLWMASPYLMGAPSPKEGAAAETAAQEKLFKVRVKTFTAIPRVAVVTANGVTAASKRVDARARTNGTIMESLAEQGQSVKAGDVLCRLDMASRENNLRPKRVTDAAMAALQRYRWRGNIRELRNTIERLVIMTPGDAIDAPNLPETVRVDGGVRAPDNETVQAATLREHKEVAERAFLVQKLRETGWNISKTADLIDTPRSNLYKKLEQYRITQETDG